MSAPAAAPAIIAPPARKRWGIFPPRGVVLGRCRRRATQGGGARRRAHSLDEGLVTSWRDLGSLTKDLACELAAEALAHEVAGVLGRAHGAQQVYELGQRRLDGHIRAADHSRVQQRAAGR